MTEFFIENTRHAALVKALASIKPGIFTGSVEAQIKIILGEIGDIWPERIRDDVSQTEQA